MNGFLAVDAIHATQYFMASEVAVSEAVALFFYRLARARRKAGCHHLTIFLDNNSTHQDLMRYQLYWKLKANPALHDFRLEFKYTPRYSPDFNLVDYAIHLVRLKLLHHLPAKTTIAEVALILADFFRTKQLQTAVQIRHTINHILKLGGLSSPLTSGI